MVWFEFIPPPFLVTTLGPIYITYDNSSSHCIFPKTYFNADDVVTSCCSHNYLIKTNFVTSSWYCFWYATYRNYPCITYGHHIIYCPSSNMILLINISFYEDILDWDMFSSFHNGLCSYSKIPYSIR